MDRFHQSFRGEVHITSLRRQTLTIVGMCWLSNMFTGESKADTRSTSRLRKEQLKNGQLRDEVSVAVARATGMSRTTGRTIVWTSHQVALWDEMHSVAGDALISREEICSVKQSQNFKDIRGRITNIFRNFSNTFNAIDRKFKMKRKEELEF